MMWQALTGRSLLPIVVAVSVGCLLTLPWEQDVFKVLVRDTTRLTEWDHLATDVFTRESFNFTSQGIQCDAWLYLPAASALRGSTRFAIRASWALIYDLELSPCINTCGVNTQGLQGWSHSWMPMRARPCCAFLLQQLISRTYLGISVIRPCIEPPSGVFSCHSWMTSHNQTSLCNTCITYKQPCWHI